MADENMVEFSVLPHENNMESGKNEMEAYIEDNSTNEEGKEFFNEYCFI